MTYRARFFAWFFSCIAVPLFLPALAACKGAPDPIAEVPIPVREPSPAPAPAPQTDTPIRPAAGGITEEIRSLAETGAPSSLLQAIDLIRSRDLGSSDFGRALNGVCATLIRRIYPAEASGIPAPDMPQTHPYTRIIREAEKGSYIPPQAASTDYFEHILPFLALLAETRPERLLAALPHLLKAQELRPDAALAPYFAGMVFERTGQYAEAAAAYTRARNNSRECYPAALGTVRVLNRSRRREEARRLLVELSAERPGNAAIRRQLILLWYEDGNWAQTEQAAAELLRQEPRDGELVLIRAHALTEQGQYMQAQAALDTYASFNPNTRLYLFLRARVQIEGYRNREPALGYLRTLLRTFPGDEEAAILAARLLLESANQNEQAEGRELLRRLTQNGQPSLAAADLGLADAIRRENWQEAQGYLNRLLAGRRSAQDLINAHTVERGLGNAARALGFARELYDRDQTNDDGIYVYISALIDNGRQEEAGKMIESRLAAVSGGAAKSRYYYLRSRLAGGGEEALADLRTSLFEDPRNINSLIALFEAYHNRKDERRAVYYLKQAVAISPNHPQLRRYANEYPDVLK